MTRWCWRLPTQKPCGRTLPSIGLDVASRARPTPVALAAFQRSEMDQVVADHQGRQHQR